MYACAAFRWHGNAENFYPLIPLGGVVAESGRKLESEAGPSFE